MVVKDDVRIPDVENMASENAVTRVQKSAFLEILNGTLVGLFDVRAFVSRMRDLDVNRAGPLRSHGFRKIHRETNA